MVHRKRVPLSVVLIAAPLVASSALAQAPELEEIVVTARRAEEGLLRAEIRLRDLQLARRREALLREVALALENHEPLTQTINIHPHERRLFQANLHPVELNARVTVSV